MPNDGEPPQRETLRTRLARLIAGGPEPEAGSTEVMPSASPSAIRLRLKEFETSSVRDVMTSRVDIAAVDVTVTIGEVLGVFATEAHSRMPVFRDSIDEPLGFIHIKDVVAEGVRRGWSPDLLASPIEKLMREIMFVPESILLRDLLIQMQASRIHIAMVVDEYGGTGGMVCLEDLVESIVGDIEDEHDDARPKVSRRGRSIWDVDGLASIEHVERETGLPLHVDEFESDVDTIGGLVAALGGRVLQAGESIEHPRGPVIEVLTADPRRVIRLRIRTAKQAPAALAEDKTAAIDR
ncbi:MAG: CBS domain-containing protein [Burkholderiales bacterium]|nr:MAG: CBS domain-containing protein [Burkholderiales bacterium]